MSDEHTAQSESSASLDSVIEHAMRNAQPARGVLDAVKRFVRTEGTSLCLSLAASASASALGGSPVLVSLAGPAAEKLGFFANIYRENARERENSIDRGMQPRLARRRFWRGFGRDSVSILSADLLFHDPGTVLLTLLLLRHGVAAVIAMPVAYLASLALAAPFSALAERLAERALRRHRQWRDYRRAVAPGEAPRRSEFRLEQRVYCRSGEDARKLCQVATWFAHQHQYALDGPPRVFEESDTFYDTSELDLLASDNVLKVRTRVVEQPEHRTENRLYLDTHDVGSEGAVETYRTRQRERVVLADAVAPVRGYTQESLAPLLTRRFADATCGKPVRTVLRAHNKKELYLLSRAGGMREPSTSFGLVTDTCVFEDPASGRRTDELHGLEIKLWQGKFRDLRFLDALYDLVRSEDPSSVSYFKTAMPKYALGMSMLGLRPQATSG